MRVLRGCNMISLAMDGGKMWVLLGFFLLASCVPPVWTIDYLSLNASSFELKFGDRLVSTPNPYFEFGIFQLNYSGPTTVYYLGIRYAFPIEEAVTWMTNRSGPALTGKAVLQFKNGALKLSDGNQNIQERDNMWNTFTDNMDIVSVQLNDTGNLLLKNKNGTVVWNSLNDSPPTDTLLPGQSMNRSQGHNLISFKKNGDPKISNDTYSFGWDAKGVLTLSWICPKEFLNWKGGSYIPAPDVYAAHTIQNVDRVYFHKTLGHLYIDSKPPTAILSGGPDQVNATTLKRITMALDGGLRILQYMIHQPWNETLQITERWKAVANWVVSDRPDSRSQCAAVGTCGQYSECVSPFDSLEPVTCRCPGRDNITTQDWFTPIDGNDTSKGCNSPTQTAGCLDKNGTYAGTIDSVGMLELPGVDMPWGGDYRNITGNDSVGCQAACAMDCFCAGAVYSQAEKMCWLKNGALYNLGYPTVALHGTDRTSYLRNQNVPDFPKPQVPNKDNKLVKILAPTLAILGALLVAMVMFCLCRNERVRQKVQACCKTPTYEIKFPGDPPAKNERGVEA